MQNRVSSAHRSRALIATIERYLPNRIGVAATVLILLGSAGFGVVKGGHLEELTAALSDTRNALANSAGFRITTVAINGRKQLTQDEVLAIGGVNGRSSLLFLDAETVRDKLKANPWIGDATVLKLYPGQLQIDIVERSAFALWQRDGRLAVIADDGAVLRTLCDAGASPRCRWWSARAPKPAPGISSRCWIAIRRCAR